MQNTYYIIYHTVYKYGIVTSFNDDYIEIDFPEYKKGTFSKDILNDLDQEKVKDLTVFDLIDLNLLSNLFIRKSKERTYEYLEDIAYEKVPFGVISNVYKYSYYENKEMCYYSYIYFNNYKLIIGCSCPYDFAGLCKHLYGLLLKIKEDLKNNPINKVFPKIIDYEVKTYTPSKLNTKSVFEEFYLKDIKKVTPTTFYDSNIEKINEYLKYLTSLTHFSKSFNNLQGEDLDNFKKFLESQTLEDFIFIKKINDYKEKLNLKLPENYSVIYDFIKSYYRYELALDSQVHVSPKYCAQNYRESNSLVLIMITYLNNDYDKLYTLNTKYPRYLINTNNLKLYDYIYLHSLTKFNVKQISDFFNNVTNAGFKEEFKNSPILKDVFLTSPGIFYYDNRIHLFDDFKCLSKEEILDKFPTYAKFIDIAYFVENYLDTLLTKYSKDDILVKLMTSQESQDIAFSLEHLKKLFSIYPHNKYLVQIRFIRG